MELPRPPLYSDVFGYRPGGRPPPGFSRGVGGRPGDWGGGSAGSYASDDLDLGPDVLDPDDPAHHGSPTNDGNISGGGFSDPGFSGGGFSDPGFSGGGFSGGGFSDPGFSGGGFSG